MYVVRPSIRLGKAAHPAPAYTERLLFIEGIRGLAALYVVLGHFASMSDWRTSVGKPSHAPVWLQHLMAPLWFGHLAVASFIVVSGFCLQTSLFSAKDPGLKNVKRFYRRRARRILPAYYMTVVASVIVSLAVTVNMPGMPFIQYLPVTPTNVVAHLLLIHNLSPAWMYKLNGVLWSIGAEAQLYVVFPLLVWSAWRVGRPLVMALAIAATWFILRDAPTADKLYVWYLPLFTLGMISSAYAYRPNLRIGIVPSFAKAVSILAGIGAIVAVMRVTGVKGLILSDILIGLAVASACYLGATRPGEPIVRTLSWKPLVGLGGFSYSLYLMHHPIQQVVYRFRPAWVTNEATSMAYLLLVGLPIILLGTYLFARLFEQPFQASRKVGQATARAPVPALAEPLAVVHTSEEARRERLEEATLRTLEAGRD